MVDYNITTISDSSNTCSVTGLLVDISHQHYSISKNYQILKRLYIHRMVNNVY